MKKIILPLMALYLLIFIPVEGETLPGSKAKEVEKRIAVALEQFKTNQSGEGLQSILEGILIIRLPL